jgi:hypothetical protein
MIQSGLRDLQGTDDARAARLWDLDERYERLSAVGDPLEKLNSINRNRDMFLTCQCSLHPLIQLEAPNS